MTGPLVDPTLAELMRRHPAFADFLATVDGDGAKPDRTLADWLDGLGDERLAAVGLDRAQVAAHLEALAREVALLRPAVGPRIASLTLCGGRDKRGLGESLDLTLRPGDVVCIVGPTGSGKSRLLADIECLAQGDTPSGRRILIDGAPPEPARRWAASGRLVAQLSQNMNFVVDLSVADFLAMHADCRAVADRAAVVRDVVACANDLAGETFTADVSLTQLSGGQTRALMIADTALLSASPIVLIDEIENAGIDRKRALDLLVGSDKIVLISTHDPILALLGHRRIVIANGSVADIVETGAEERAALAVLERYDRVMVDLRRHLRHGGRIDELPSEFDTFRHVVPADQPVRSADAWTP